MFQSLVQQNLECVESSTIKLATNTGVVCETLKHVVAGKIKGCYDSDQNLDGKMAILILPQMLHLFPLHFVQYPPH